MSALLVVYLGLGLLGSLAQCLERRARGSRPAPARSLRVDAIYWIITPMFTGVLTRVAVILLGFLFLLCLGNPVGLADVLDGLHALDPFGVGALPLVAQLPLLIVLADLLSYISHRARHAIEPLTALHDVHHAPRGLTWTAAARMHPLDDLIDNTFVFFPLFCFGFDIELVLALGPALLLHTIYLHADCRVSLGPLEHWIATPAFHRAHHAVAGRLGNFGGVLSIWDRLLGTYRAPTGSEPTGLPPQSALPESVCSQLVVPIRRALLGRARA